MSFVDELSGVVLHRFFGIMRGVEVIHRLRLVLSQPGADFNLDVMFIDKLIVQVGWFTVTEPKIIVANNYISGTTARQPALAFV